MRGGPEGGDDDWEKPLMIPCIVRIDMSIDRELERHLIKIGHASRGELPQFTSDMERQSGDQCEKSLSSENECERPA